MNKHIHRNCPPPKRKPKKKCPNKKLGIVMVLLGIVTMLALFLPMKYWVVLLSIALIAFGIILLKNK